MRPCALLVVCAALAAGCGRGDDERAVTAVSERFLAAVERGDGETACAQLAAPVAEALAQDEQQSCAQAAAGLPLDASAVRAARVYAVSAKVELADGDSVFLQLTRSGWRIAAAGCTPGPGDEPYHCEVEA